MTLLARCSVAPATALLVAATPAAADTWTIAGTADPSDTRPR